MLQGLHVVVLTSWFLLCKLFFIIWNHRGLLSSLRRGRKVTLLTTRLLAKLPFISVFVDKKVVLLVINYRLFEPSGLFSLVI
jgi:hypothetical protein